MQRIRVAAVAAGLPIPRSIQRVKLPPSTLNAIDFNTICLQPDQRTFIRFDKSRCTVLKPQVTANSTKISGSPIS
ncbi:hypothetical protein D3C76_1633320 [compost metagenome]